jgi:hypothetical protein
VTQALARLAPTDPPAAAIDAIDASAPGAIELARPALDDLPYQDLVRALLGVQGFRLDLRGQSPAHAVDMLADRLLGPGTMTRARALLAGDLAALVDWAAGLVPGARPQVQLRSFFAPGDTVWHLDRVAEPVAFRLLWPIGRPEGMGVTTRDNISEASFAGFMRREHPLLSALDTQVAATGRDPEAIWAHRPRQLEAMRSGAFPFIRDPARTWWVTPGMASVHRVDTPRTPGTYHRSSWANRRSPGLQLVVTVAG